MYHFRVKDDNGVYRTNLNIHCVPVKAGRARVIYAAPFGGRLPKWLLHAFSNRFLNTDTWLHDAERQVRALSETRERYVHASEADRGVQTFRKWWKKHGQGTAPPNTFGPAAAKDLIKLNRAQQIDPWEYHAKHCSHCRKALKNMKRIQAGGLVVALASIVFLRQDPIPSALVAGLGLFVRQFVQKTATIIEGNPYQSGIADRSVASMKD